MAKKYELTDRVQQYEDGKYRWVYEFRLFRNPAIYFLVWKIFFFIILGMFILLELFAIQDGNEVMLDNLKILGYFLLGMTVVTGLGYSIYALIMGGKYIVEFEMDEKGIIHKQTASQAKKAKKLGGAKSATGFAAGQLSTAGAGYAAQRTEMHSDFERVKSIKLRPLLHIIKVNEPFCHNQVYVKNEDFDFVKDYIISHCPNTKNSK